jgi:hypothetical protein
MKTKQQEAIIWEIESEIPIREFFEDAKELELDYVIYVIDAEGNLNSVWACAKEQFNECMFTLSNKCYFGRVQSLSMALQFGFFDEAKGN